MKSIFQRKSYTFNIIFVLIWYRILKVSWKVQVLHEKQKTKHQLHELLTVLIKELSSINIYGYIFIELYQQIKLLMPLFVTWHVYCTESGVQTVSPVSWPSQDRTNSGPSPIPFIEYIKYTICLSHTKYDCHIPLTVIIKSFSIWKRFVILNCILKRVQKFNQFWFCLIRTWLCQFLVTSPLKHFPPTISYFLFYLCFKYFLQIEQLFSCRKINSFIPFNKLTFAYSW